MTPEVLLEADFRVLGLEPGSRPSEVRRAYRELAKKWHPDCHHSESYETRVLAEQKFREIDEAYKRISERWKESPHLGSRGAGPGDHRAAAPGARSHGAQGPEAKVRAVFAALGGLKIVTHPFTTVKIAIAAVLLAAAVFALVGFRSFFPHSSVDTQTSGPQAFESPLKGKDPRSPEPSEASGSPPPGSLQSPVGSGQEGLFSDDLPSARGHGSGLPSSLLDPQPVSPKAFFTLGSSSSEVLGIQGTPSRVQGQTWIYGLSEVEFKNGRVWKFNNFDGTLRVRMLPRVSEDLEPRDHITVGSSEEEVLLVQGTPTRVEEDRWSYGFAELIFKDGRVAEYDNYFGNLKIRVLPSAQMDHGRAETLFTIGSTPDEVLAAQGTPTAIHGNRWSFGFASVLFQEGKVHSVVNPDVTLRFIASQKTGDTAER